VFTDHIMLRTFYTFTRSGVRAARHASAATFVRAFTTTLSAHRIRVRSPLSLKPPQSSNRAMSTKPNPASKPNLRWSLFHPALLMVTEAICRQTPPAKSLPVRVNFVHFASSMDPRFKAFQDTNEWIDKSFLKKGVQPPLSVEFLSELNARITAEDNTGAGAGQKRGQLREKFGGLRPLMDLTPEANWALLESVYALTDSDSEELKRSDLQGDELTWWMFAEYLVQRE